MLVAFLSIMKVFKKYIMPFLVLYLCFTLVISGAICWMTTKGWTPVTFSDYEFMLTFVLAVLISGLLGFVVMNHNKNIKAVYANVSKQPLLIVCVGEGLFATNALMANLFDGLVFGSLIVIFPLFLYVMKTMRDIKETLS